MADTQIKNLCMQYARNKVSANSHILDCGDVLTPYVQDQHAVTMLKSYNSIIESHAGAISAYLHEKQHTSNQPDWKHKTSCPCYTPEWKHPGNNSFIEDDDCFCDTSGLFVDFDIKMNTQNKYLTQEIVNEIAFEVTKLLYKVLAQVEGVIEGNVGVTGEQAIVGPVENLRNSIKADILSTIVCYSSLRTYNGKGRPLEKFKEDYWKEGIHLMYPGLNLQRDTKHRLIMYLRGVAKDKSSDLYQLLEKKVPNHFPHHDEFPGCYEYIDVSAWRNLTVIYGSIKHQKGKAPGVCNYMNQTCNYFVFTKREFDKRDKNIDKKIIDFTKAVEAEVDVNADDIKRTRMFMFNYTKEDLANMYTDFCMALELSLVFKDYDKNGYPTGLVRQVPYKIPDYIKNSDWFIEYTKEYKSKIHAVNHDIKTRLEDKNALEAFEKNHIGYCNVLNEKLSDSPMLRTYNIISSLSRKRASTEPTWYTILVKLKQIAAYYKRDDDGLEIAKHFSKRHNRENDPGYYDEAFLIDKWNRLPITVVSKDSNVVSKETFFSNYYSLLSLVKSDSIADYINFCDSDFMERLSKFILDKKAFPTGISDIKVNYSIGPNEMVDIIIDYIKPFYKSGLHHNEKTWAEFDFKKMRWIIYSERDQKTPISIETFVTCFVNNLINNSTSKYLRRFDTNVSVLFNRILNGVKREIKITSGNHLEVRNDVDDSDEDDDIPGGAVNNRRSDEDSIARVLAGARGVVDDDGDIDLEEEEQPRRQATRGRPKKEISLNIGEVAKFFRWFCIRSVGGNVNITSHDSGKYKEVKVIFEECMRKMKISISPEMKANYFSYISTVNTYDEISKFPVRYLSNMSLKLFGLLRDDNFFEVKDTQRLFVGVKNGVLELRHCAYPILHKGFHNFPITLQMGCDYKQFDPTDNYTIKVLKALKSLFIDTEHDAFDYMMKSLCLALDLDVHDTTFDFFFGGGGNGKTTATSLMSNTFKEYASEMSVALIEKGRNKKQAGTASPELLKHENKRFIIISEANDIVFEPNVLKRATGGDKMEGRLLNDNNDHSFMILGRIVITLNNVPTFTTDDEGIRRRVISVPFRRSFVKPNVKIQSGSYQCVEDQSIMKYAEDERYLTAFLSILTFYYANLTGMCHLKYFAKLKIEANKDLEEWKSDHPKASIEEINTMKKKFVEKHIKDYEEKPQDTIPISISNTGRVFPTIESATQQFLKEASPAYRFLADRIFTIVNIDNSKKVPPIFSEKLEEESKAVTKFPMFTEEETAAYHGVSPPKVESTNVDSGVIIDDGNGKLYRFREKSKFDTYLIDEVDNDEEEISCLEVKKPFIPSENGSKIALSKFPFKSFTRVNVDLDFIIEQYNEYQHANHKPPANAEIKKGFSVILNKYSLFDNSAKFKAIFIDNDDYKHISKISNFVGKNKGTIKPFTIQNEESKVEITYKQYKEELNRGNLDLLEGMTYEESVRANTVEDFTVPFGYTQSEKSKSMATIKSSVRIHNSLSKINGTMFQRKLI